MIQRAILLLLLLSPSLGAVPAELQYTPAELPSTPNATYLIVRLFLYTGLLISLCLAVLWASRKWNKVAQPGDRNGQLEYLASIQLDRRCSLHLIDADGQAVLIGTDLAGLKVMQVIESEEPFDDVLRSVRRQNGI